MSESVPVRESPVGSIVDRLAAYGTIAVAATVVVMLAGLAPDRAGHGTHEQLGLDPCGWPIEYGVPCPTCGVTTAATHLVHLDPVRAFVVQPFGALLALFGLFMAARATLAVQRGNSFVEPLLRWDWLRIGLGAGAVLLAAWAYKWATWPS